MIVYNLTMHVEHAIQEECLKWQKEEHIPAIMNTGQFTEYRFFHLLEQDETEGVTYVLQYIASSPANYQNYLGQFATALRKKAADKWGNRFVVFRTVMEVLH